MGLFDFLSGPAASSEADPAARQAAMLDSLRRGDVPEPAHTRLADAAGGRTPWVATLTPAELRIVRDHGLRPMAAVTATCWLHYGWSWTLGHAEGWNKALERLAAEARACGANAVLDVKMRTILLDAGASMDFSLVGTAVRVEGLDASADPVIATVPALEFVQLLAADVVPVGIAVGAHYEWMQDWRGNAATPDLWFNAEARALSALWDTVRHRAHADLRQNATGRGNGVLAHVNFSQMFREQRSNEASWYLARHIVVATTVDARRGAWSMPEMGLAVDLRDRADPNRAGAPGDRQRHHQSYGTNQTDGAI